jgi:hypothetical protein
MRIKIPCNANRLTAPPDGRNKSNAIMQIQQLTSSYIPAVATWSEITCNGAFLPQNYIQYPRFCPLEIAPNCLPAATMFN